MIASWARDLGFLSPNLDGGCVDHNFNWFGWVISPSAGIDTNPLLNCWKPRDLQWFARSAMQRKENWEQSWNVIALQPKRWLAALTGDIFGHLAVVLWWLWPWHDGRCGQKSRGMPQDAFWMPAECLQRDDQRRGVATDCVDQSGYPTWADSMILRVPKIEILHFGPNT